MHLAKKINKRVTQLYHDLSARKYIGHDELREVYQKAVKPFGARVEIIEIDAPKSSFAIGGVYEPHRVRQPITIEIYVSEHTDKLRIVKKTLIGSMLILFQTLCHEYVHKYQYQHRSYDDPIWYLELDDKAEMTEGQTYLAEVDEIEAYGQDIALELLHFHPDDFMDQLRVMTSPSLTTWQMYCEAFKDCHWQDIRKRLLKKAYQYVTHIHANGEQFSCTIKSTR